MSDRSSGQKIPDYNADQMVGNLQGALLGLLCDSTKRGVEVAIQVNPELYDVGPHREIAKAAIAYRLKYSRAPRKQLPIMVENLPLADEQKEVARLLAARFDRILKGMNRDYIVEQARTFAIRQTFKKAALSAAIEANKLQGDNELVRKMLYDAIMYSPENVDKGMSLADERSLAFLDESELVWPLGIKPLDDIGFGLSRGTSTLYLGPKNSGKSWACVHVGRQMLKRGLKVLHVTLEMSDVQVAKRYHQAFNAMSRNYNLFLLIKFDKADKHGVVGGFDSKLSKPRLAQTDPRVQAKLRKKIALFEREFKSLRIKRFPPGQLSVAMLTHYLDQLGSIDDFHPDVVIVDYPDLMEIDKNNYRLDIGRVYIGLRGLAVERNFALFTPSQVNRIGMNASLVTSTHSSEDMHKVNTADNVLTYSQTKTEKGCGLARLYANHARDTEAGLELIISQAYTIGQYVIDAYKMTDDFKQSLIEGHKGDEKAKPEEPAETKQDYII